MATAIDRLRSWNHPAVRYQARHVLDGAKPDTAEMRALADEVRLKRSQPRRNNATQNHEPKNHQPDLGRPRSGNMRSPQVTFPESGVCE